MKLNTNLIAALGLAIAAGSALPAQGALKVWNSISSTDWNTAANWTASGVPGAADEAQLGAVGTVNPTLSATSTVNGLILTNGQAVTINTGAFQLRDDGGYATPVAGTILNVAASANLSHSIVGDKSGMADFVIDRTGNAIGVIGAGTSLTIDATVGVVSGSANTRLLKQGDGLLVLNADSSSTWTLSGNPSATQKALTVRGGAMLLNSVGARGANTNSVSVFQGDGTNGQGKATLQLAANYGDLVNYGGTNNTECILELSGRGWQGGVDATGEGALNNVAGNNTITAPAVNGGRVTFANNGNFSDDVRIRVAAATSLDISAPIVNGAFFNPGPPLFEKTGGGLLTFSGSDKTYTGNTVVMDGILRMNSIYTGGGSFTVNSGATLQGTGSVGSSAVTVNAGGFLAPGASIESLAVGSASGGGTLLVEYDGDAAVDAIDLLTVSGSFNISAMGVDFDLLALGDPLDDTAVIFAKYGSLTGSAFASVADLPAGYALDYAYNDGIGTNNIALVAVPEPNALMIMGMGAVGMLAWRKNRRS
jgi:autotransporter-associated beta strand protein